MGSTAWPAADGTHWDWNWTPYPGVWAALLLALLLYAAVIVWLRRRDGAILEASNARWKVACFAGGVLVLWLALDWPLGGLASNLFAARTAQYLVITLIAAPLLLLGTPPVPAPRIEAPRALRMLGRWLTKPLVAAVIFSVTLLASHLTVVVNALEPDPAGAAMLRGVWLAVAVIYWYPLVGPGPARERLPYLGAVGYLVLPFLLPKAPGVLYVFATRALYAPYDHAGRAGGMPATADQGIAGFLLWIVGSIMVLVAVYLVFRRWGQEDRELRRADSLALPADPEAVAVLMAAPGGWQALEQVVSIVDDSLPERHLGVSLSFRIRRRRTGGEWRDQVVLVVHFAGQEEDRELLEQRVLAQFAAHVAHYDAARREAIAERLAVEVEPLAARVL